MAFLLRNYLIKVSSNDLRKDIIIHEMPSLAYGRVIGVFQPWLLIQSLDPGPIPKSVICNNQLLVCKKPVSMKTSHIDISYYNTEL
jgi:hypothetical protein